MVIRQYSYYGGVGDVDWVATFFAWFFGLGALYLVAATVFHLNAVHGPREKVWFTTEQYLGAAGLDVGETYNLRLGSATGGGSVGDIDSELSVDFFLFAGTTTSTTSGRITPSSAVRLSYRTQGNSYILEIPYSRVQFKPQEGAETSVRFIINNYHEDFKQHRVIGANFWTFQNGHLSKMRPTLYDTNFWVEVTSMGLPTYLAKSLSRVEFVLTPQQYSAYLGTLQTTGK